MTELVFYQYTNMVLSPPNRDVELFIWRDNSTIRVLPRVLQRSEEIHPAKPESFCFAVLWFKTPAIMRAWRFVHIR